MSIDVKQTQGGSARPSLRAERAAVTRRRILEAARLRFGASGYGATTLQAIAREAGVAVQTVYAVYRSKAGILRALREGVVHRSDADAFYAESLDADDASRALTLFARSIRARWEAGADIVLIHAEAAAADSALRAEVEAVLARRRAGIARLVDVIADSLAGGVDIPRAIAIVDALTLPEVYSALTGVGEWTAEEYESWLGAALARELLDAPP